MHLVNKSATGPQPYTSYLNGSHDGNRNLAYLGWNYPAEIQHLVHEHWRGYPVPEIYYNAFFFIYYFILSMVSLFGNGLVLFIFSTSKNLRTPSNLLIINLAVFDLLIWTNMPHYLMNSIHGYIVGGDLGCSIYAFNGALAGLGAAITNAFIAFDRYRTISNPIDGRLNFAQIVFLIIISWLWTLPFSVLPLMQIWGRYIPEGFLTTCALDYLTDTDEIRIFNWTIFTWAYIIPMAIICTCYTKLFLHVRDHERMLAEQAQKMNIKSLSANADPTAMSVEMRIAKAAFIIYFLYLLSWTPYATVNLMPNFGYRESVTPFISMLPACTCKMVSGLDPWVYAVGHPKYRLELERRLPWLGIRERGDSSGVSRGTAADTSTVSAD